MDLRRLRLVGLGVWAALVLSPVTAVLEPLTRGRDDSWAILVLYLGAYVGLGAAVQRAWALVLGGLVPFAWFVLEGAEGLAWLALMFGLPAVLLATAIGWLLGRATRRRAWVGVTVAFAVAAVPLAWGAREQVLRATAGELPRSVQARLPLGESLGNLCPNAGTPGDLRKDLRRRTEVLLKELRRRPHAMVRYTYYYEETGPERTRITLRELAEEQLRDLETGSEIGRPCAPDLQRRLRDVLDD